MSVRIYSKKHPIPNTRIHYVGRPGQFGNPFHIGRDGSLAVVLRKYESWINEPEQRELREKAKRELAGVDLLCYCAPKGGISSDDPVICHAQILARIVNGVSG